MISISYNNKQTLRKLLILTLAIFLSSCSEKKEQDSPQSIGDPVQETIGSKANGELEAQNQPKVFSKNNLQSSIQNVRDISLDYDVNTYSEDLSLSHYQLITRELLTRIEILSTAPDYEKRALVSRLEDIIDALTLLRKADKIHGIKHQNHLFLDENYSLRIKALEELWQKQPHFAVRIDTLLSNNRLLTCEHAPQLFRQWALLPDESS